MSEATDQKFAVLIGDNDIDYADVYGIYDSVEDADAALGSYNRNPWSGEYRAIVVPILPNAELQEFIKNHPQPE